MRLRLFIAFVVVSFGSLCQAESVHLASAGANDVSGCGWCMGPSPTDVYLTLDTRSWSQDVLVGSSTNWVTYATVRYKSPGDLRSYLDWAATQGYDTTGDTLDLYRGWEYFGWEASGCHDYLVTVDGELPGTASCVWSAEPQLTIGPNGSGLSSLNQGFAMSIYSAYYPQHKVWVTTGALVRQQLQTWTFGDSPNEQTQNIYMTFDVTGPGTPAPEPCTAVLFAGVAPILVYRSFRHRR